ncbi:LPS export ABC transporter periplasmic protein LptC [Hippea sp. KM1]|uniref:LPS export ABC transporter periplasmic protein LptC n=1 Tax=Hippea sp. KM1 TaxID=944481 RepID=UPI00046CBB80|nr:LPS export ABC transporter periplasmic protein LptC [Hippea sp. KM1]
MVSFKKLTLFSGYFSLSLLFGISAFLFVGFMQKETIKTVDVSFNVKEKASGVDVYKFSKNGKYHIVANRMVKLKNGVVKLIKPKLWVIRPSKPPVLIVSGEALVYPNNDIYASGGVVLKRRDLVIEGDRVSYNSSNNALKSDVPFHGRTDKSKFKGRAFVYYLNDSKLVSRGVSIWLR